MLGTSWEIRECRFSYWRLSDIVDTSKNRWRCMRKILGLFWMECCLEWVGGNEFSEFYEPHRSLESASEALKNFMGEKRYRKMHDAGRIKVVRMDPIRMGIRLNSCWKAVNNNGENSLATCYNIVRGYYLPKDWGGYYLPKDWEGRKTCVNLKPEQSNFVFIYNEELSVVYETVQEALMYADIRGLKIDNRRFYDKNSDIEDPFPGTIHQAIKR